MKLATKSPKIELKLFLKQRPSESERDKFKKNLISLLDKISVVEKQPKDESEEHLKNNLRDFLRDTFYLETNAINTKDKKDLVIHIGKSTDTDVAVIIEAKRPSNKNEMVSADNANKKALHELILYYLTERNAKENVELKQLIITDINQWFIIDANYFDKYIYRNPQIRKLYETKVNDKKDNPWFYEEIAKIVSKIDVEIPCVYFDIRDYEKILRNTKTDDDKELVALYKILSPQHLLKIASPNDSNALNERFYKELLHIIGLEEARVGTKNIIRRKKENKNAASLIELTIEALKTEDTFHSIPDIKVFGANKEEQTFNISLELSITWINRVLFLKLLEGQLISYHQGNNDYRFLNSATIHDYDELFKLFHKVLAVNILDRTEANKAKYSRVPYLNSSLFEISELEDQTIKINSLENDGQLELINTTVLKEIKKKAAKLPSLDYLFQFLDAYDFASEGTEDWQKDNEQLINASVLGKVFEKINGYKDGSFFTPGFITMYMCRETIRKAVVQKFNETNNWKCKEFDELKEDLQEAIKSGNRVDERKKANEIVNSIKICDPAVGSGHFLVSALNEIIAIKDELKILVDKDFNPLSTHKVEIANDELVVYNLDDEFFYYNPNSKESQRIQETLFHEKHTIIENCLFGVDINPNSVKICRLRLWIELLKNAYYKNATELETLPNIDINIKCGNSLVSRFAIDADLKQAIKKSKWTIDSYRIAVQTYRNAESKEQKREMEGLIADIKSDFRSEISLNDPKVKKLNKLRGELFLFNNQQQLFDLNKKEKVDWNKKVHQLTEETKKLETEIEVIKANKIFENTFEWRFEFPEVLNDDGDFVGFDVVIGNPPYGISLLSENEKTYFKNLHNILQFKIDTYELFLLKSIEITRPSGISAYIIPSTFIDNFFGEKLRELLITKYQINQIIELDDKVFEEAVVHAMIFSFIKIQNLNNDYEIEYAKEKSNMNDFIKVPSKFFLETAQKSLSLREYLNKDFYTKLKSNTIPLKKIIDIRQAIKTGNDKVYISEVEKAPNFKKVIGGKHIGKWAIKWDNKFVDYGSHLACPRDYKIFEQPKILIREAGNQITATLDKENYYILSSLYNGILTSEQFEIEFIISQLNSKLFQYLLNQLTFEKTKGAFTKARIFHYYELPIKKIEKISQNVFVELANQILSEKKQNPIADTTAVENQIDHLVYQLYELTEEEIKTIENA